MAEENMAKPSEAALGRAYGKIAKELLRLGDADVALVVCEAGLKKAPNSASIHITKGEIAVDFFGKENKPARLKEALISFDAALKSDPQNYLAKLLSAQIYLKAGSRAKAKAFLKSILKIAPDDDRATALLKPILEKEEAERAAEQAEQKERDRQEREREQAEAEEAAREAEALQEAQEKSVPEHEETATEEENDTLSDTATELVIAPELEESAADAPPSAETRWSIDEQVVISVGEEDEDNGDFMRETLASKLTIFSRLDNLLALFLIDNNGQPISVRNRAKLDEEIIPSMAFNLVKASMNGVKRSGLGNFRQGVLVTPFGTMIVVSAFYATLAVIMDNDADNFNAVETRIQRYLAEIAS